MRAESYYIIAKRHQNRDAFQTVVVVVVVAIVVVVGVVVVVVVVVGVVGVVVLGTSFAWIASEAERSGKWTPLLQTVCSSFASRAKFAVFGCVAIVLRPQTSPILPHSHSYRRGAD